MSKFVKVLIGFIVLVVLCGMFFSKEHQVIELEIGNYTVNEVKSDEVGISNEYCGVELLENNEFIVHMGWGYWHNGIYEIEDNKLICKSKELEWDGGAGPGSISTDVIFTFEIINDNKLKLDNIKINDTDNETLVFNDGLEIGMTYSKKVEEINKEFSWIGDGDTQE